VKINLNGEINSYIIDGKLYKNKWGSILKTEAKGWLTLLEVGDQEMLSQM
jgi:hypothetical protein